MSCSVSGKATGVRRIGHRAHEHARGVESRLAVAVLQPGEVVGAHQRLQRLGTATRGARRLISSGLGGGVTSKPFSP